MRTALAATLIASALAGCQTASRSTSPDTAVLQVRVHAEPKSGTPSGKPSTQAFVPVYDAPPAPVDPLQYGGPERVDYEHLDSIIIWLETDTKYTSPPVPQANVIVPFKPRTPTAPPIQAAKFGDKLMFKNDGDEAVAIYSVSDGNEFETQPIKPGASFEHVAMSSGLIEVMTDTSQQPVARVYVAPSYWARSANAGDTLHFKDVPPGDYRAVTWHERLPGSQVPVTMKPGKTTRVTTKVGVNSLPKVPTTTSPAPQAR